MTKPTQEEAAIVLAELMLKHMNEIEWIEEVMLQHYNPAGQRAFQEIVSAARDYERRKYVG